MEKKLKGDGGPQTAEMAEVDLRLYVLVKHEY